jgi:uncharacterized repeat protein (TIGR03803 family)
MIDNTKKSSGLISFAALSILCATSLVAAPTLTTIGGVSGPIAIGGNGVVYVAYSPGAGAIFSLTPPQEAGGAWVSNVVYGFTGGADGGSPLDIVVGPVQAGQNVLYGVTSFGGASNLGTVFSLTPPQISGSQWTETVLYNFTGAADSRNPGALAIDDTGIIYGVTEGNLSETSPCTVFSLKPPAQPGSSWTEKVLTSFTLTGEQGYPMNPPVIIHRPSGRVVIYGTIASGIGEVYSLESPDTAGGAWTEKTLYNFAGNLDGAVPTGTLAVGKGEVLYGTTAFGGSGDGGTVYSVTPPSAAGEPWTESVLGIFFAGDQNDPLSGLALGPHGVLFGTTYRSGPGPGGIFSVTPPAEAGGTWTLRTIFSFDLTDGAQPQFPVVWRDGALHGTTDRPDTTFSFVP